MGIIDMNTKKTPMRALKIVFNDGTDPKEIEIGKYTQILKPLNKVLFHMDKLDDGKILLIVGADFVEDFRKVDRIEVVRNDI
jgi:hypothetical protein